MRSLLLPLLLSAPALQVLALSSHSPQDLFAHPKFQVVLSEQPILNDTARELLRDRRESPRAGNEPSLHLLRTPAGQVYLCSVPYAAPLVPAAPTQHDVATRQAERAKGLDRGLALIDGMKGNCLYLRQGWFTYSFCYGQEIRQYHELRGSTAAEDPNSDSYTLGQFPAAPPSLIPPKYGSGSASLMRGEVRVPATLGGDVGDVLAESGGRYLSMRWEGGTVCDKTGEPRSVDVQFHCNTGSTDRIALIRETAICQYVLIIHTSRLCTEPVFLEGHDASSEPSSLIDCRPVVRKLPDPKIDELVGIAPPEQLILDGSKEGLSVELSAEDADLLANELEDHLKMLIDEPGTDDDAKALLASAAIAKYLEKNQARLNAAQAIKPKGGPVSDQHRALQRTFEIKFDGDEVPRRPRDEL